MGFFDRFKKQPANKESNTAPPTAEALNNIPGNLSARLLFIKEPVLAIDSILAEIKKHIPNVEYSDNASAPIFFFPDYPIQLEDLPICAQVAIINPAEKKLKALPPEAFQQNWHWRAGNDIAKLCKYELLVSDMISRGLDRQQRVNLFTQVLQAVIQFTQPDALYFQSSQALFNPTDLINAWQPGELLPAPDKLRGICNVRLYNVSATEMLMDTIGLHTLGLPDWQIIFSGIDPSEVANFLWNYAAYTFLRGDVIKHGDTIDGRDKGSKWRCEKSISEADPERVVMNILAS